MAQKKFLKLALAVLTLSAFTTVMTSSVYAQSDNQISILSSSAYTDDVGYFHVIGQVQNNSPTSVTYVQVIATFYDSAGKVVSTSFTYTDIGTL